LGRTLPLSKVAPFVNQICDLLKLQRRNPRIDEMVFKGIELIKSNYSESKYSWDGDPLATALALRALKIFERQITFPVDELLVSLEGVNREARSMIAIDAAIRLNLETQHKINELQASSSANLNELQSLLQKEKNDGKFAKDLSLIASIFALLTISSLALFINYLLQNQKVSDFLSLLADFISDTYMLIIPTLAIVPLIFWILLLIRYKRMPKWLENLIRLVK
jgi:hypothetical protein